MSTTLRSELEAAIFAQDVERAILSAWRRSKFVPMTQEEQGRVTAFCERLAREAQQRKEQDA